MNVAQRPVHVAGLKAGGDSQAHSLRTIHTIYTIYTIYITSHGLARSQRFSSGRGPLGPGLGQEDTAASARVAPSRKEGSACCPCEAAQHRRQGRAPLGLSPRQQRSSSRAPQEPLGRASCGSRLQRGIRVQAGVRSLDKAKSLLAGDYVEDLDLVLPPLTRGPCLPDSSSTPS